MHIAYTFLWFRISTQQMWIEREMECLCCVKIQWNCRSQRCSYRFIFHMHLVIHPSFALNVIHILIRHSERERVRALRRNALWVEFYLLFDLCFAKQCMGNLYICGSQNGRVCVCQILQPLREWQISLYREDLKLWTRTHIQRHASYSYIIPSCLMPFLRRQQLFLAC